MLQTCLQSGAEASELDVQKGLRSSRTTCLYESVFVDRSGFKGAEWIGHAVSNELARTVRGVCEAPEWIGHAVSNGLARAVQGVCEAQFLRMLRS